MFTRDGDLDIFVSVTAAAQWMEAIDVEAGEYSAAFSPDGTVLEISTSGDDVVLRLTGRRDRLGLEDLLGPYQSRLDSTASDQVDPGAFADAWLRREWDRRWPKRPAWLSRRLHGPPPEHGSGASAGSAGE